MSKRRKFKPGSRAGTGSENAGSRPVETPLLAGWLPAGRFVRSYPLWTVCLLLVVVTLTIYLQTLGHEFTNYDDWVYVTDNANVRAGLSTEGVKWAFTTNVASNWHPLTWLSHMLDSSLYGLKPAGHHFTSVFLHLLNALLLFLLLTRMTGSVWRSAFVAALFAAHPLRVESVAWVAERKDVLSGLFWILTMLAYVWYAKGPDAITLTPALSRQGRGGHAGGSALTPALSRRGRGGYGGIIRYLLVLLLFALGLMAKPMLVTLPFVLLLMDYWPLGRQKAVRALVAEKLPMFAMAAASSAITYLAQQKTGAMLAMQYIPFAVRAENAIVACAAYIGKMIWPANLSVFYPHPGKGLSPLTVAGCLILLLALSILALRNWRRRPYLAIGWLWFVGTLIPVIGLVQVGEQAMADRYSYLTMIGLFIIIAWGIPELAIRSRAVSRELLPVAAAVVIVVLVCVSYVYTSCWRNSRSLFERALASTKNNYVAENNLGEAFEAEGKLDLALKHYYRAADISPVYVPAQGNLANMMLAQGNIAEAVRRGELVVKLAPEAAGGRYNLGVTLQKAGRLEKAERQLREAIRLDPKHPGARGTLGNVLLAKGRIDDAMACFEEVLRIDPNDQVAPRRLAVAQAMKSAAGSPSEVENQRGAELANQGKFDEAIGYYRKAIRLDPRNAAAHSNLGAALGRVGRQDEAISHYNAALRVDPELAEAHYNLASALMSQGGYDDAISHLQRSVRIKPEFAPAYSSLALCLYYKGDYAGAWRQVHLCRQRGGDVDPTFLGSLSQKMPDVGGGL